MTSSRNASYAHETEETELNDDDATSGSSVKLPDSSTGDYQVFILKKRFFE